MVRVVFAYAGVVVGVSGALSGACISRGNGSRGLAWAGLSRDHCTIIGDTASLIQPFGEVFLFSCFGDFALDAGGVIWYGLGARFRARQPSGGTKKIASPKSCIVLHHSKGF